MKIVSIVTRKLKKGKTYSDFRKTWFHTVGFGTASRLYSAINVFDERTIIVVGFVEIKQGQDPIKILQIDVKERLDNPLADVIEPEIGRSYGILVSEDDFSSKGKLEYKTPRVDGKETDFAEVSQALALAQKLFTQAALGREEAERI